MPSPVAPWVPQQFLTPKSLNLALYTSDGTVGNTTGIAFATWRPILFEAYSTALTIHTSAAGIRTSLASSGATTSCWVVLDTAGYFGQSQDLPAQGYYQLKPVVLGSTGDGVTPGGWYLAAHFAPLTAPATQTSAGADLLQNGAFLAAGSRQQPISGVHSTPFFLDLVNCGQNTFAPAVLVDDSAAANCAIVRNATDSSGETPRFYAIWAAISATSAGQATFTKAGTYTWLAPAGVNQVTVAETGGGAGGGAGNSAVSSFGGGGGGGGEFASGTVGVTGDGQHSYPVTVGTGGTGGTQPGANGANGGVSTFTGNSSLTANGGQFGAGATTAANGAPGLGGTGSAAPVHFHGGAGAAGVTNKSGGGGGSSAGTTTAGNAAAGAAGAPAPPGGGPGGAGGGPLIAVVQIKRGSVTGTNSLAVTMPAAFQAGNTVAVLLYYQGRSPTADPTVTLSDGTPLTSQVSADVTSTVSLQVRLFDVYNIAGGETGVSITCHGTDNSVKAILCEVYEVAGLGPSPTIDKSTFHTQGPANPDTFYTSGSVATTKAPELWVAMTGAQYTDSFSINFPAASQKWNIAGPHYASNGGIFGGILTAQQVRSTTGTLLLNGTFSHGVTKGSLAAAYASGAATVGQPPPAGPGGGGGGGFGQNPGANGADGQVTLTWTTAANQSYGTPALPAPQPSWDETTPATAALVNGSTGIAGVVDFLANPPAFRAHATAAQSIANAPASPVPLTLGTVDTDPYSGWNSSTNTYTVQRAGIYLAGAMVPFAANATGIRLAGISVNGTTYWGPACNGFAADLCCATKTQVFSLNAGDTVQVTVYQNSSAALSTGTAAQARLFLVWLSAQGTPSPLPAAPDPGFRWQSGTPGPAVPGLMTQHLSQDLTFLVQRPYFVGYQSVAQTGLANNAFSTVTLDQALGIVHGDAGDNYTGWTSGAANNYAAVPGAPGWYLVCGEMFTSSGAVGSSVIAAVLPSTSGGFAPAATPDWYQHLACGENATAGGGATIFGLYQLSAGESVTPQVQGAAMGGTYSTLAATGFGGKFGSHLAAVWMSS